MTNYLLTGWTSGRTGAMKEPGVCRECDALFQKRSPNQQYCAEHSPAMNVGKPKRTTQKTYRLVVDPSGDYAKNSTYSSAEVHTGVETGAWEPGTIFVHRVNHDYLIVDAEGIFTRSCSQMKKFRDRIREVL